MIECADCEGYLKALDKAEGGRAEAEEATEQAWSDVLSALLVAFGESRPYNDSPVELIAQLADERDEAKEACRDEARLRGIAERERDEARAKLAEWTDARKQFAADRAALDALLSRPAPPADAATEAETQGFHPSLVREVTNEAKTWLSAPYSNHGPQAVVDARGIMFRLLAVIHESTAAPALTISGMHNTCDLCQCAIPDGCYAVFCGECEDGLRAAFDGVKRALLSTPAPAPSAKEGRT